MEHDAACEMAEVRRTLETRIKFTRYEIYTLFVDGVGGISCRCYERAFSTTFGNISWRDVLERTEDWVRVHRAQARERRMKWGLGTLPKVGDKFTVKDGKLVKQEEEAQIIEVDFRNRRRVD